MRRIAFFRNPSVGVLRLDEPTPTLVRESFTADSTLFSRLNEMAVEAFNYAYINNILVIADTADVRPVYDLMLEDLPINTKGDFILFAKAERKNGIWLASSLTLRDWQYLKEQFRFTDIKVIE